MISVSLDSLSEQPNGLGLFPGMPQCRGVRVSRPGACLPATLSQRQGPGVGAGPEPPGVLSVSKRSRHSASDRPGIWPGGTGGTPQSPGSSDRTLTVTPSPIPGFPARASRTQSRHP
eukprot:494435-Hanusia_phi.AAC.2